jgi:hypothetical protein
MNPRILRVTASVILRIHIGIVRSKRDQPAGGGGDQDAPDKVSIGLLLDTLKEECWQRNRDRFVAAADGVCSLKRCRWRGLQAAQTGRPRI